MVVDTNVATVIHKYLNRAEAGLLKYGVTTERTDIDLKGWLQHLQCELMDATIYVERLIKEVNRNDKEATNS